MIKMSTEVDNVVRQPARAAEMSTTNVSLLQVEFSYIILLIPSQNYPSQFGSVHFVIYILQ